MKFQILLFTVLVAQSLAAPADKAGNVSVNAQKKVPGGNMSTNMRSGTSSIQSSMTGSDVSAVVNSTGATKEEGNLSMTMAIAKGLDVGEASSSSADASGSDASSASAGDGSADASSASAGDGSADASSASAGDGSADASNASAGDGSVDASSASAGDGSADASSASADADSTNASNASAGDGNASASNANTAFY